MALTQHLYKFRRYRYIFSLLLVWRVACIRRHKMNKYFVLFRVIILFLVYQIYECSFTIRIRNGSSSSTETSSSAAIVTASSIRSTTPEEKFTWSDDSFIDMLKRQRLEHATCYVHFRDSSCMYRTCSTESSSSAAAVTTSSIRSMITEEKLSWSFDSFIDMLKSQRLEHATCYVHFRDGRCMYSSCLSPVYAPAPLCTTDAFNGCRKNLQPKKS